MAYTTLDFKRYNYRLMLKRDDLDWTGDIKEVVLSWMHLFSYYNLLMSSELHGLWSWCYQILGPREPN